MRLWLVTMLLLTSCAGSVRYTVRVKDEAGRPIRGADVYAFETWPGGYSTLLDHPTDPGSGRRTHGPLQTNARGEVDIEVRNSSRVVVYEARYAGWPAQRNHLEPRIVLGPARSVRGTVVLPEGCPPQDLSVGGSPVQADGSFTVSGLGPMAYGLALRACGREAAVKFRGADLTPSTLLKIVLDPSEPVRPAHATVRIPRELQLRHDRSRGDDQTVSPTELAKLGIHMDGRLFARPSLTPAQGRLVVPGADVWLDRELVGVSSPLVSDDGRFVAGVRSRSSADQRIVLLDVREHTVIPVALQGTYGTRGLRFYGPWLLVIRNPKDLARAGDSFAVHTQTRTIRRLAMGVEIDRGNQDAILRGPIVVQREYSNGHRVIVSRLDEGDAISLGDFDRFDVSADGQWMLGHRGVSHVVIARTDGSSRIEMSGTAKFTGDGRRIMFKNAQVGVSGTIELVDLDAGTRTPIASGVGDFTSLADGRVVYLAGGDVHIYTPPSK